MKILSPILFPPLVAPLALGRVKYLQIANSETETKEPLATGRGERGEQSAKATMRSPIVLTFWSVFAKVFLALSVFVSISASVFVFVSVLVSVFISGATSNRG